MKTVKNLNRTQVISLPENYAELVSHDLNGDITYDFCVLLNQRNSFKANSKTLRMTFRENESLYLQKINVNDPPEEVVKQVENKNSNERGVDRQNSDAAFKRVFFNLESSINSSAVLTNGDELGQLREHKRIVVKKKSEISEKSSPIYQKSVISNIISNETIENLSRSVIDQENKDPSEVSKQKFLISDQEAFAGVVSKSQALDAESKFRNFDRMSGFILNKAVTNNNSGIAENEMVVVVETVSENIKKAFKRVKFSSKGLNVDDHFYVTFEILNNKGVTIERYEQKIPHGKNMLQYQKPKVEPRVHASAISKFKNIFEVTQEDPHAKFINIYSKVLSPNIDNINCHYKFLDQIEVRKEDGTIYWTDEAIGSAATIYRFIAADTNGSNSGAYTNVIARNSLKIASNRNLDNYVVLATQNTANGLEVEIKSIPSGYQDISLKRVSSYSSLKTEKFIETEDGYRRYPLSGNKTSVLFLDKDINDGKVYEYFAVLTTLDGYSIVANPSRVIEHHRYQDSLVDTFVDTPSVDDAGGELDVSFRVESTIRASTVKLTKDLLSKKGMLEFFQSEVAGDKEFLEKLIAHKISRQDLNTGEEAHFVTFHGEYFSDKDNQTYSGAPPLRPGASYQYKISPMLRNPISLFENRKKSFPLKVQIENFNDGAQINASDNTTFDVDMYKFSHPIANELGSVLFPGSNRAIHAKNDFEFGLVGIEKTFEVTLDSPLSAISSPRAKKVADRLIKLTWDAIGEKEKIDHYLVILSKNYQEEIIGRTHAIRDTDRIEFYHVLEKDEIAWIRYRIVPVFLDYTHGASETSPGIIIE